LGVSNYWFSIKVRDLVIGTAFVQALDKANHILRERLQQKPASAESRFLSRAEFDDAARLLQFIAQSAETAVLAELNQADVEQAQLALGALQQERDRLREHIQRLLPEEDQVSERPHSAPPPLVHRMLELVHQHYAESITLQKCARTLGRNAAYLSSLFAQAVGLPFKVYLTELRLEKSKELLVDPNLNVNEVAQAVGYAGADRFRITFKQHTGLSPRDWREMMRPTL
jgi:YesN/AraC family two-component response regulator